VTKNFGQLVNPTAHRLAVPIKALIKEHPKTPIAKNRKTFVTRQKISSGAATRRNTIAPAIAAMLAPEAIRVAADTESSEGAACV
jgi:hypothetical protein